MPPVHDYGALTPKTSEQASPGLVMPWMSHDTSTIPSISSLENFRIYVALCLVEKSLWESQDTTLLEKLQGGHYWDICGEEHSNAGIFLTRRAVRKIPAVEVLSIAGGDGDVVENCHNCKHLSIAK